MIKKSFTKILTTVFLASMLLFAFSAVALADDPYFQGSGTEGDAFLLSSPEDLMTLSTITAWDSGLTSSIRSFYKNAWYQLQNDIDMAGYDWRPICEDNSSIYYGDFNGNGYTVSNLKSIATNSYNRGFFGWMGGKVYNLTLENVNFQGNPVGTGSGVGGVAGALYTNGVIENVNVTGTLTGVGQFAMNIGGIAGIVTGPNARISNCTFVGNIEGTLSGTSGINYVGGIVGNINQNGLTIENCYSSGIITRPGMGGYNIGKIAGGSGGTQMDNATFINNTTSMTVNAETTWGIWYGNDGIEVAAPVSADLNVTVDQTLVQTGDSFNVRVAFAAAQKSNTARLTLTYNPALFTFAGFTADADRISTDNDADAGVLTIYLGDFSGEYNIAALGTASFTANSNLPEQDNDFSATVEYVTYDGDGEKVIAAVNGSASVATQGQGAVVNPPAVPGDTNGDDSVDLIDLSNIIDWFGIESDHAEWDSLIKFFDFNENGKIDISDISYIASQI